MSTPDTHLRTLFSFDNNGRILGTREAIQRPGPKFVQVRGMSEVVWAVRSDVPDDVARELGDLASEEPLVSDLRREPLHIDRYLALVKGELNAGPAFAFPKIIARPAGTELIDDVRLLHRDFSGWEANEIPASSPIIALIEQGHAVSACFCARRSDSAAEAGVETAVEYRGRGFATRVTAGWALAVRASGRTPLYSTSWSNSASIAIARKLGLIAYASSWSIA